MIVRRATADRRFAARAIALALALIAVAAIPACHVPNKQQACPPGMATAVDGPAPRACAGPMMAPPAAMPPWLSSIRRACTAMTLAA